MKFMLEILSVKIAFIKFQPDENYIGLNDKWRNCHVSNKFEAFKIIVLINAGNFNLLSFSFKLLFKSWFQF